MTIAQITGSVTRAAILRAPLATRPLHAHSRQRGREDEVVFFNTPFYGRVQHNLIVAHVTQATEAYPQLEVPLFELASDGLHVRNVPRAFHHGLEVLRSPPHLNENTPRSRAQFRFKPTTVLHSPWSELTRKGEVCYCTRATCSSLAISMRDMAPFFFLDPREKRAVLPPLPGPP